MEKNRKNKKSKILHKILAIVATLVFLTSTVVTFASASDVQNDAYDVLVSSIPLESISHEYIENFGTSNFFSGVYENPFIFYNNGLDVGRSGKAGVVLNYPYQSENFTDVGRTIYYEFDIYKQNGISQADISIPLTYQDGRESRNPFNCARSTMVFSDFVIDIDSEFLFYIYNSVVGKGEVNPPRYDVSFNLVVPNEYNSGYDNIYIEDSIIGEEIYLSSLYFSDLIEDFISSDIVSFYITDLKVSFLPFSGIVPSHSYDMYVSDTYFTFTLSDEGDSSADVREWLSSNPIINKEFVGIGEISLTDWIATAVGGFFDFEIMPNVTLGGIGLVFVGVALFMLFIRIYRG